jgi:hypothetical protein
MKLVASVIAIAVPLALVSTVSFAGPQLEEKGKPGYPYPGTKATDEYGKGAEKAGTTEVNKEEMRGSGHPAPGMSPDRPGYPYPGTKATEEYGKKAEDRGTRDVNKEQTQGTVN